MPIRPPLNVPRDLREWTKFFQEAVVTADDTPNIVDADIPATIARDAEVSSQISSAISNHVAAVDPHTQYATDTDLSNHVAAADPHTVYQKESEKDAVSGYAGLNSVSRTTKGVDTTDDLIVDDAANGLVLKDTQGTPHYWRITISNVGVPVITDLGTTKP